MDRSNTGSGVRGRQIQRLNSPQSSTYILQRGDFTGGPTFYAESVDVTPKVTTGGVVDVVVTLANERRTVTPLNPAYCDTGGIISNDGLGATITVEPSWTPGDSTTACLGPAGISPTREDYLFDYEAPDVGGETYYVDVTVEADGSDGKMGGTVRYEVYVPEEGTDDDDTGGRPGEGGRGDGTNVVAGDCTGLKKLLGNCGDSGGGSLLGTQQTIALAAFAILVIVAVSATE